MIATHLREVHYRLVITCDLCKSFTSMSIQSVLDHHSGCKAKSAKEFTEQKGHKKVKKIMQEKVQVMRTGKSIPIARSGSTKAS